MKKQIAVLFLAGVVACSSFANPVFAADKPASDKPAAGKPAAAAADKPAIPTSGKVAVVNGTAITAEELDRELNSIRFRFAQRGRQVSEEQLQSIRGEVLNNLIGEVLLFQESQKQGVKIEPSTVEEQFAARKKQYPSEEDFQKMMKDLGFTEKTAKENFGRQLAVKKLVEDKVEKNIKVQDEEAKAFYDKNIDTYFKQPDRVRASHILVKVAPDAAEDVKATARKRMEAAVERVKKGEDFAVVAKEVSEDSSAAKGGDLDFFARGMMVKPFEDAAFSLKPGEMSGIVETQFGLHLIKVTDRKEEAQVPFADVKEKIIEQLFREKVQKEVNGFVEELRKKAKVEMVKS